MQNENKEKQLINNSIIFVLFATFIVWAACIYFGNTGTQIKMKEANTLDSMWQKDGEEIELPYKIFSNSEKTLTFTNILPNYVDKFYAISFLSNYALVEVYVNDELIYTYGNDTKLPFSKMTGNIRCIIPLDKNYAGKRIDIKVTHFFTNAFEFNDVYCDNINTIYLQVLKDNLCRLIIIPLIFITAVISIFIALMNRADVKSGKLFYFSLFAFGMCTWLISSSDIPQFFTSSNTAIAYGSFVSLTLMCVFFAGFCKEFIESKREKLFLYFEFCGIVFVIIQTILFILNVMDPIDLIAPIHMYMFAIFVCSIYCILKEEDKDEYKNAILQIILFFLVFVVIALISFYKHPGSGKDGIVMSVGFTFFIFSVFYVIMILEINEIKEASQLKIYKELAFKDGLTGLGNRAALEKYFSELPTLINDGDDVTFIMFDLNYLKRVNDNIGHDAGDKLITSTANCIKDVFGSIGTTYRLGGDEFAALLINESEIINEKINELNKVIEGYNKEQDAKISLALGYCNKAFDSADTSFKESVYKKADDRMYEMKKRQHKELKIT